MENPYQSSKQHEEIRPEYSVSPDDDLYGSPRSWTGFRSKVGSSESPVPSKNSKSKKRPYRGGFKSAANETPESSLTQRFFIQAIGAVVLFAAMWMFFHSDRPIAKTVQGLVQSTMRIDYSTIVMPPAIARNFGTLPSSAITVLPAAAPKISFIQPMAGKVVRNFSVVNPDVVIQGRPGAHVLASADGLVVRVGESQASGNYVVIDHGSDGETFYSKLGTVFVKPQEYVVSGQLLGILPSHQTELTFGYIYKGAYRNPLQLFQLVK